MVGIFKTMNSRCRPLGQKIYINLPLKEKNMRKQQKKKEEPVGYTVTVALIVDSLK